MSNEQRSANTSCRAFVILVLVTVVCAFLLVIFMSGYSPAGIRHHFSVAAHR